MSSPLLLPLLLLLLSSSWSLSAVAQCPWGRDPQLVELQSSCLCAINLNQQLSIQCNLVNFTHLTTALTSYARYTTHFALLPLLFLTVGRH